MMESSSVTRPPGSSSHPFPTHPSQYQPSRDLVQYVREYARQKPDVAALWCFGIGFVLGWKIKPW